MLKIATKFMVKMITAFPLFIFDEELCGTKNIHLFTHGLQCQA